MVLQFCGFSNGVNFIIIIIIIIIILNIVPLVT